MPNSNRRKAKEEEIKEYLIALSEEITEISKVLREEINTGGNINICLYLLISKALSLDRMTEKRYADSHKQFTKDSLAKKKND